MLLQRSKCQSVCATLLALAVAGASFCAAPGVAIADNDQSVDPDSDILLPAVSFILPGFGQWWKGQSELGAIYTGTALGGLFYASHIANGSGVLERVEEAEENRDPDEDELVPAFDPKDNHYRKYLMGTQIYSAAGGFSAYQAFRDALPSWWEIGEYGFLEANRDKAESVTDIMLAPLAFHNLSRWSSIIPLGFAALVLASARSVEQDDFVRVTLTKEDVFFTSTTSFMAGTYEEAMFRGWLLPVMHRVTNENQYLSNIITAAVFAVAHLSTNPRPIPQFILGYHFGYVTMKNDWTLEEAVFIHTWWDVFVFLAQFSQQHKKFVESEDNAARMALYSGSGDGFGVGNAMPFVQGETGSWGSPYLPNRAPPILWLPPLLFEF